MTTTVKVQSHNDPVLVRTIDRDGEKVSATERVFWPEDGEQYFYSTRTRTIECVDLAYNDQRAVKDKVT